ncbi:filamentous haemagglutinin family protein [Rubrivivax rivuli]|uniref:Filamentous hemagglutinin N-terminal domain-containing protein n=1 Tax=Rubrivivax rivuli TaxID=1862385 RepID=A0A437REB7_9BURK|nr:filamentous haemagglutinin family protein [Rubrivivax rivuli]RVU45101.1 filamentous hemagglutinin N-terminal domain-containing protein [Rubrivivax rivuli]
MRQPPALRLQPPRPQATALATALSAACLAAWLLPAAAWAQAGGANLAPNTVPQLRGVVAGQAVVNAPVPGAASALLTIEQQSLRAVLDWRSFNIGSNAEVLFRHAQGASALTLNRIYDANPSVIQGRLASTGPTVDGKATAGGQVILINQNGILFDRGARVDTQSLLASTLNLGMSNSQFCGNDLVACSSGAPLTAGGLTTSAFAGGYDELGNPLAQRPDGTRPGNIGVGSFGPATAAAPRIVAGSGGSVILVASRIDLDAGLISAPDGQVVLAAGSKAFLAVNGDASDITLRGLVVEVEAHRDGPGLNLTNLVRNAGTVEADRGNVTIAALAINQEGRVSAKTAVQRNGSIYLSAGARATAATGTTAGLPAQAGQLRLAAGSTTEVMPDLADTAAVPESADYAPYRGEIRATGGVIESHGRLQAAGGRIGIEARNEADPLAARVYFGAGSLTSVAGQWSDVDPARNIATFRVTSNELKNAPDQKTGVLLGATVTVDLAAGNNILALDGYRAAVPRTVAEKAARGGELSVSSTGSLVQRSGATLDVSGGGYRHAESRVATSTLLGEDGRLYDIATAPQALRYSGQLDRAQYNDARWGQTGSVLNLALASGQLREAHVQGQAAGTLRLGSGAGLVLDGALAGGVTIGQRQTGSAPAGGTLYVGTGFQPLTLDLVDRPPPLVSYNAEGQRIGNVSFRQQAADTLGTAFGAGTALTQAQRENVQLAAGQLFGSARDTAQGRVETGFSRVEVNSDGRITLPENVSLQGGVGASLTLRGPAIDLAGDVSLPAGSLLLAPQLEGGVDLIDPGLLTRNERLLVRSTSQLSVAGAWLNRAGPGGAAVGENLPQARLLADGQTASATQGGSLRVSLVDETFQTRFERGAVLDASGGALLDAQRRLSGGNGGQITLAQGNAGSSSPDWMQAELRGPSIATGASLTYNVARAVLAADGANGTLPAGTTRLTPAALNAGGFASLGVNAANGLTVAEGADFLLQPQRWVVDTEAAVARPAGTPLRDFAELATLPAHQRSGASLSLSAGSGVLAVGRGASLRTDAGGRIALTGGSGLNVDGRLEAPAGTLTLSLRGPDDLSATPLRLGAQAQLLAGAAFLAQPSDAGLVSGRMLNAGTVTLDARQASLVAEAGSLIDVSGLERTVQLPQGPEGGTALRAQTLAGHAGTLVLRSQGEIGLGGTLRAAGPGSAAGGSVAIELLRPDLQPALPAPRRLLVSPGGVDATPAAGVRTSRIDGNALQAAGFEKLRLLSEDIIEFQGSSTLAFERGIRLDAPVLRLGAQASVTLQGAQVALGQSLGPRTQQQDAQGRLVWTRDETRAQSLQPASAGTGVLVVDAGSLDLYGASVLDGVALARLGSQGDVRFIGREVNLNTAQGNDPALIYQAGALRTAGNLEFRASQLYPATRTRFSIEATGSESYLLVQGNGRPGGEVYSVAGALSLKAPQIVQAGTVRAPLGSLDLQAGQRLELAAGSVSSVSGEGLTVLYGGTLDGVQWRYADGPQTNSLTNPRLLDAVTPEGKRLNISAPETVVASGAVVDLRGGGNVQAVEFVPGNGGDADIANAADTFAILPRSRLAGVPYDTYQQLAGGRDPGAGFVLGNPRDANLYDSVQIGEGARVPAGEYVLLPTRFATLPGAFLVQLQTGSAWRNLQPGQTGALANGETVVAGFRSAAGTSVRESQSVGVVVLPGSALSRYSDYTLSGAQLFASQAERAGRPAPASPWDAGRLGLQDARSLTLAGNFLTASSTLAGYRGRAAEIDITGQRIAIVDAVNTNAWPADTLQISAATLSSLKASVLVGGTRSSDGSTTTLRTTATQISVDNSAASPVQLPELLLAAREGVQVSSRSVLRAAPQGEGASAAAPELALRAESSGALLRLSSQSEARIDRGTVSSTAGEIDIAAGALLEASRALLLDATRTTRSAGSLRVGDAQGQGGSLSLATARISLGDVDGLTPAAGGLLLSNSALAGYAALGALTLRGYEQITLQGTAAAGSAQTGTLTLDTPVLAAGSSPAGAGAATLQAQTLRWVNSGAGPSSSAGGDASLVLQAQQLTLGAGAKATQGFSRLTLAATTGVDLQGQGALRAAGELQVQAPVLQALGGAQQQLVAVDDSASAGPAFGALRLGAALTGAATTAQALAAASAGTAPALGGRVLLQGARVQLDGELRARSGHIEVAAEGGGLTLGPRALLDARGAAVDFKGSLAAADGGSVQLRAAGQALTLQAGSQVDVSAAAEGGRAGSVGLQAGSLSVAGQLRGEGRTAGGSAALELQRLDDFSALNGLLNTGGFTEQRSLRLREGDIEVRAGEQVDARGVQLSADSGRIDVRGTVGRNTEAGGGRLALHAATGLQLHAGSRLLAAGTGTAARGGEVRADTRGGALAFDNGATIDVRAGALGQPGAVIFGTVRDAAGLTGPVSLAGQVLRHGVTALDAAAAGRAQASEPQTLPATLDLELTRVLRGAEVPATLDAATLARWGSEHAAFAQGLAGPAARAALAGLRDETGVAAGTRVTAALEVQAAGDLGLAANWNLTQASWLTAGLPGTLTLRAGGALRLQQTVGGAQTPNLPATAANAAANDRINVANHAIAAGDTWHIRMTAGADLQAADPLATRSEARNTGHLVLSGNQAGIRTGTGRIDLAAAGDIRLENAAAGIYTAGRIGAADTATNGNNRWAVDGGGISLRAGGSLLGPAGTPDLWVTEWLRRPRQTATEFTRDGFLTDWWSYRPRFQQGVATLGGGDIEVRAGQDVRDLMFALPTSGRTELNGNERRVEVGGGGSLAVQAGGDVDGASFLIGRGQAQVLAGGSIGATQAAQAYLMGLSSGGVPEQASLALRAGTGATLQSVDNPTYLGINLGAGATGPSFHPTTAANASPSSIATTFFTYSGNSGVEVMAKSGDVALNGRLSRAADAWRSFTSFSAANLPPSGTTAFPASVSLLALGGDVLGPGALPENLGQPNLVTTWPSATASALVLARGDVRELGLEVSDLSPNALVTPTQNFEQARLPANSSADFFSSGSKVSPDLKPVTLGRIVERSAPLPAGLVSRSEALAGLPFEVQALEGSVVADSISRLYLPGRTRLRAGQDIVNPSLRMQNLRAEDLSEVRAVAGNVRKSSGSGGIEIAGPGRLLVQAGGDIDLGNAVVSVNGIIVGGLVATGNTRNALLKSPDSARLTVIAGVPGDVDLARMDSTYARVLQLNRENGQITSLYAQLAIELESSDGRAAVLAATDVKTLAARNPAFARFTALDSAAPEALRSYQQVLREGSLPLAGSEAADAAAVLGLLAREDDVNRLRNAASLGALLQGSAPVLGGTGLDAATAARYAALGERYPRLLEGAVLRRVNGARLTGTAPLVFDEMLGRVVSDLVGTPSAGGGDILSFQTSIQTQGGSAIDLWAPKGDIVVGLTTPNASRPVGVLTNQGGAVRSVLSGNFSINQGKVLTAQGGDILIYASQGSIDAGRGAKTSLSTPPPQRRPILDAEGNEVGVEIVIPASASGSGIQTLSSDPDGLGPAVQPPAGDIYLFAPAGKIDAGEAGIRSSGNILVNAQVVLNASDIKAAGSSQGVPQVPTGSLASTLAAAGNTPQAGGAGEDKAAKAAEQAARQATAARQAPRPTVLTVEVLGFGERNCREDDRECFAK